MSVSSVNMQLILFILLVIILNSFVKSPPKQLIKVKPISNYTYVEYSKSNQLTYPPYTNGTEPFMNCQPGQCEKVVMGGSQCYNVGDIHVSSLGQQICTSTGWKDL
ncbi:hypothetical protein [Paenibacillus sp. FSL R5-0486]|uniref:hypothetical protein n=1 Tax=Paenibacillus sp. FSL R5-0486 TaxID=2921645 RepID=UPI0030DAB7D3